MAQTMTGTANKPAWVDLASSDAAASRDFYSKLFGWNVEVNPDPQYGGYGLAKLGGSDAAGIGPKQDPNAPTAWSLYIGSEDIEALARSVTDNGGAVAVAPFDVGDQGRMAVFIDPAGAFISAWQGTRMGGFQTDAPIRSAGRSSMLAVSTTHCRSTPRSSAGRSRRARWARASPTTTSSRSVARASPAPGR